MGLKYSAYWIAPSGQIIPVTGNDIRHIHQIINNPDKFGLTLDYIKKVYRAHKEKLYSEGNAREEIMAHLIKDGWTRVRYVPHYDFFTIQTNKLDHDSKEGIWDWAVGVTRKFDKASKYAGVKIMNLFGDLIYNGDVAGIISYNAFQEDVKFTFKDRFCFIEDYYPSFSDFIRSEEVSKKNTLKLDESKKYKIELDDEVPVE